MNNNTAVVVAILSGLMGLLGVALGAGLTGLREAWSRKKRHLSYWSAMRAEVGVCREFGEFYVKDEKAAPLYRLPERAYENAFPALLGDGSVSEQEARSILRFYGLADQINRGLEYAQAARDPKSPQQVLGQEAGRLRLKAEQLVGAYYSEVRAAIDKHVVTSRRPLLVLVLIMSIGLGAVAYTLPLLAFSQKQEPVGERIHRECESIASEVAKIEPGGLDATTRRDLVLKCLLESATQGRRHGSR